MGKFEYVDTVRLRELLLDGRIEPEDAAEAKEEMMRRSKKRVMTVLAPYLHNSKNGENQIYPLFRSGKRYGLRIPEKLRVQGKNGTIYGYSQEEVWDKAADYFDLTQDDDHTIRAIYERFDAEQVLDSHVAADTIRKNRSVWNSYFDCLHRTFKDKKREKAWNEILEVSVPLYDVTTKDIRKLKPSELKKFYKQCVYGPDAKDGSYREPLMTRKEFNNVRSLMNHLYAYAYDHEFLDHQVVMPSAEGFHFKERGSSEGEAYTDEDREILLDWLDAHVLNVPPERLYVAEDGSHRRYPYDVEYASAVAFTFCVDCRISELKALKFDDVDLDVGRIRIDSQINLHLTEDGKYRYGETKHLKAYERVRFIPISDRARKILVSQMKKHGSDPSAFVFCRDGIHANLPIDGKRYNRWLQRFCGYAGVRYRSSHKIRFWANGAERDAGIGKDARMAVSGHKTASMDTYYDRRQRQAMIDETLDRKWQKAFN